MKTLLAALFLASVAVVPVAAEERIPAPLIGTWCWDAQNGSSTYDRVRTRADCRTSHLKLTQDGMEEQDGNSGPSDVCLLRQLITVKKDSDYVARYACKFYGIEPSRPAVYRLSLKVGRLTATNLSEPLNP